MRSRSVLLALLSVSALGVLTLTAAPGIAHAQTEGGPTNRIVPRETGLGDSLPTPVVQGGDYNRVMLQDEKHLYVLTGGLVIKIEKSTMAKAGTTSL